MKLRSLRVRLTLWYSGALIMVALVLAGASRYALAVSLDHALDQSLRYRLIGVHNFIDQNSENGLDQLGEKLRGLDHLAELFQVFGPSNQLMAQSDGLSRHHVGTQPPPIPEWASCFATQDRPGFTCVWPPSASTWEASR
jgi:hypothetical protein